MRDYRPCAKAVEFLGALKCVCHIQSQPRLSWIASNQNAYRVIKSLKYGRECFCGRMDADKRDSG